MALPDSQYVALFPVQEVIFDKDTGFLAAAGTVTFYKDTQRTVKKAIYQQVQLPDNTYQFVELNNPITLTSIGSYGNEDGDDIIPYLFPYEGTPEDTSGEIELYYITVESSGSVLLFTREAWPPGFGSSLNPTDSFEGTENELANPQFVEISFNPPESHVFTVSGSSQTNIIAPDWYIETDGTGTVTISQIAVTDVNMPSNAPFVLDITSSGITSLKLVQRLEQSPRLMANGFISASMVAATVGSATAINLIMNYVPSTGTPVELINDFTADDGSFTALKGTAEINNSNTDPGDTGYVDISVTIPAAAHIQISSLQIVGVQNLNSSTPFLQQSTARQIDHLFHYYKDELVKKPKASILTGWNFSLNPFQFNDTTLTTATSQTQYIADQTIIHQLAGSTVKTGQAGIRNTLQVQAINGVTNNRFALIQYIPPQTIMPYWSYLLSSLARMRIFTSHGTEIGVKMRLIWRTDLPPTLSNTEPVASWASTDPVFAAGWTEIIPLNDPIYTLPNSYDTTEGTNAFPAFSYDAFQMPDWDSMSADTMTLGIVVYTTANMNDTLGTEDSIEFDRISLVPNAFAVDSPPQTFDEVLRECQFFYEKSYLNTVLPGTASDEGSLISRQLVIPAATTGGLPTAVSLIARVFELQFNTLKRTSSPEVHLYSPTAPAAIDTVAGLIRNGAATAAASALATTNWTQSVLSNKSVNFLNANTTALITTTPLAQDYQDAYIQYHYTVDARLGLVP